MCYILLRHFVLYSAKEILFCFHLMPRHLNKNPSNLVIIEKVGLSGINIIHSIEIAAKILAASLWVNELLPRVPPKEGEKGENIRWVLGSNKTVCYGRRFLSRMKDFFPKERHRFFTQKQKKLVYYFYHTIRQLIFFSLHISSC